MLLERLRVPSTTVVALARERTNALKTRPVDELRTLPEASSDVVHVRGVPITVTVYRDPGPDQSVRVVAQAALYRLLGASTVAAFGFDIESGGAMRDLAAEDLWDYS